MAPPSPSPAAPTYTNPPSQGPLSFNVIATDAAYGSEAQLLPPAPSKNTTLAACKAACLGSEHPYMCMGVAYVGPPAPGPGPSPSQPLCTTGCAMLALPKATAPANTSAFYKGQFDFRASKITTLPACEAACLADATCVQLTWSPRPANPCVLYQSIATAMETIAGAAGWVKCKQGSKDPLTCAPRSNGLHPTTGCSMYTSIDQSVAPKPSKGVVQYQVVGRQVNVQHDWVTPKAAEPAKGPGAAAYNGTAPITITQDTGFPYTNAVKITVAWGGHQVVARVSFALHVRMPSWMGKGYTLDVLHSSGTTQAVHTMMQGKAGTFLTIDPSGGWGSGDTVSFTLPTVLAMTQYTGMDQIPGHEGKRYALKLGPILLAAVGPYTGGTIQIPHDHASTDWLKPKGNLVFGVTNSTATFMPMWEMATTDVFTTFPLFVA